MDEEMKWASLYVFQQQGLVKAMDDRRARLDSASSEWSSLVNNEANELDAPARIVRRNRMINRQVGRPSELSVPEINPIASRRAMMPEFEPLSIPLPLVQILEEPDPPGLKIRPVVIEETKVIFKKRRF